VIARRLASDPPEDRTYTSGAQCLLALRRMLQGAKMTLSLEHGGRTGFCEYHRRWLNRQWGLNQGPPASGQSPRTMLPRRRPAAERDIGLRSAVSGNERGHDVFTIRRGRYRGFVQQAVDHQVRWLWQVVDLQNNMEIASGITISSTEAAKRIRELLVRLIP
jgi:hypothetical protein